MLAAYLDDVGRTAARGTTRSHCDSVVLFGRFMKSRQPAGPPYPPREFLTQRQLEAFWDWLRTTPGRGTQGAAVVTANRRVRVIQQAWAWLADRDEYEALLDSKELPRPRRIKLASPTRFAVVAPTWTEMDACVAVCTGWNRRLAVVLRFTGLRVQQAMMLKRADLDLDRALLTIRPDLPGTKTVQERGGRTVPVSPHLVAEVRSWPEVAGEDWLVPSGRRGDRERLARPRDMRAAWYRAGVRREVWDAEPGSHGNAHKAFRRGFQTELARAKADEEALDRLVGHQGATVRARHYRDPTSLPLREAVALIPPLDPAPRLLYAAPRGDPPRERDGESHRRSTRRADARTAAAGSNAEQSPDALRPTA